MECCGGTAAIYTYIAILNYEFGRCGSFGIDNEQESGSTQGIRWLYLLIMCRYSISAEFRTACNSIYTFNIPPLSWMKIFLHLILSVIHSSDPDFKIFIDMARNFR